MFGKDSDVVRGFETISQQAYQEVDPKIGLRYLHTFLSIVIKSLNENVFSDIYRAHQPSRVFVGHGRNPIWMKVLLHLQNDLHLQTEAYETEPRTSEHVIDILKDVLNRCNVAVIVMTADDPTAFDTVRARQNAIHEVGFFQGRHGFGRVILLQQKGTEEFTNIAGLERILFTEDIEEGFYKLDRAIQKLGL
jgi:predicted nucleotide-binding protein